MASIVKKKIRGQTYYYAVESKRVNGKPRIVWQKYLGKVNDIVHAVTSRGSMPEIKSARVNAFGVELALLAIAKRLGVVEIINRNAGWNSSGLSTGEYLLLSAIYFTTAPDPRLTAWYDRAILKRYFNAGSRKLTEKGFWSAAGLLTTEVLGEIQTELAQKIISEFSPGPEALVYDGLMIAPDKSRKGEAAATQVAVITTREFNIPLFYSIYKGGLPDKNAIGVIDGLVESYCSLGFSEREITVVNYTLCKSGEVLKKSTNQKKQTHSLAVLDPVDYKELLDIPPERFHVLREGSPEKVLVYRVPEKAKEKNAAILMICSEADFGHNQLDCERKLLITDNLHWGNREIHNAFSGRRKIAKAIDRMKIWPGPHSAPKGELRVMVNAFCLVLALTMQSLLRCELSRCGVAGSAPEIFKILSEIREVALTYAGGGRSGKKKHLVLAELDPIQKEIYNFLRLGQLESGVEY